MGNAAVWVLIVSASVCVFGSLFVADPRRGMHRADVTEMFRRHRMVEVLRANTRPTGRHGRAR
ncbi:hypothetical protein AB0K68_19650 [Streptomyces sp. NPDC050698]